MDWNSLVYYDETSPTCLRWKIRKAGSVLPDGPAGGLTPSATYPEVRIDRKVQKIHRIIWQLHHGPIPEGMVIDHIDRNPANPKISNLRMVTPAENARNRNNHRNSRSGFKWIYWCGRKKKWRGRLKLADGTYTYSGYHKDPKDAYISLMDIRCKHGLFEPPLNNHGCLPGVASYLALA